MPSKVQCAEEEVSFQPLDMPNVPMTLTTLEGCRKNCAEQDGCMHFSFLQTIGVQQGSCHLAGFSALAQVHSPSWVSGPPHCWTDIEDKSLLIDKGHNTYVPVSFACMKWGSSFGPALDGNVIILAAQDYPKEEDTVLECQKRCKAKDRCQHFTVQFPLRTCTLAGSGAAVLDGIAGAISGPPKCNEEAMQSYYWEILPSHAKRLGMWTLPVGAKWLLSGACVAAVVASLACWRRRKPLPAARIFQRALITEALDEETSALE